MALIITSIEKATMNPLAGNIAELPVAGTTVEKIISSRFPVALSRNVEVRADFIPSRELAARLAGAVPCTVTDPDDGSWLARVSGASDLTITPDAESIRITYPWDLLKLNEMIIGELADDEIAGEISPRAEIRGKIRLGQGSVILPGVFIEGNAVIGENCKIGPNCYIRGNTSVGDNCHIGQAVEIKNSIIGNKVAIGHLSYAGDSVIMHRVNFGAGTIISNFRHDGKNHKFKVGNELVDTGRRKFGAIIAENVHTGIHTSIYPGRYLAENTSTRPGEIVEHSKDK